MEGFCVYIAKYATDGTARSTEIRKITRNSCVTKAGHTARMRRSWQHHHMLFKVKMMGYCVAVCATKNSPKAMPIPVDTKSMTGITGHFGCVSAAPGAIGGKTCPSWSGWTVRWHYLSTARAI